MTTGPTVRFVPYEPASFVPAASSGESADSKRRLMHSRVIRKASNDAASLRRKLRRDAKAEVDELINSFVAAVNGEDGECDQPANDQEHEAFWMNLPTQPSRDHSRFDGILAQAPRNYPGKCVRTRTDALRAAMNHGKSDVDG